MRILRREPQNFVGDSQNFKERHPEFYWRTPRYSLETPNILFYKSLGFSNKIWGSLMKFLESSTNLRSLMTRLGSPEKILGLLKWSDIVFVHRI